MTKAQELVRRKFRRGNREYAKLGDFDGHVLVPGYNYLHYARVLGVVQKVWNRVTDATYNLEVEIEYQGTQIVVIGIRGRAVPLADGVSTLTKHADTHREGGIDPVYIWMSQILNLRIVPNGFTVQIWQGRHYGETWHAPARSSSWNLATYQPVSGAVWVLIYVDRDGAFQALEGETADSAALLTPDLIPALPFGAWAVAAIRLYDSQTAIDAINDVYDLRWAAMPFNAASGTSEETISSGAITAHSQFIYVYGEGAAADDLATINGGAHGSMITLCAPDEDITIKHGTGNIYFESGADVILTSGAMVRSFIYDATQSKWIGAGTSGGQGGQRFGGSSNYTQLDTTGHQTMVGTAKPWEDLRIEPVARTSGTGAPTFEKWFDDAAGTSIGVFLYSFTDESVAGNEKQIHFTMQMPHAWDGGPISMHVHFVPAATVNASEIIWGLEYAWKDIGETFGDTTIVYSSTTLQPDDANITAGKHYIAEFADLTPGSTADGISSILIGRLFRNSSDAGDTYTNKVGLLYIDAHYQLSSLGSTDEYVK